MKEIFLILIFYGVIACSFGQKNPTKVYGTVPIDNNSSIDATEVTIGEWIYFIINNGLSADLFPNPSSISKPTKLLFDDLRKQKNFEYVNITKNNRSIRKSYGTIGFKATTQLKILIDADSNYFSINNPIVGISFHQALKFCKWRESLVNKFRKRKVHITLPSVDVYKKININKDSLCKAELSCNDCSKYQFNYYHEKCALPASSRDIVTQGRGLLRADSYWPSELGLYNIQGNAAEMTSTPGIAVGGSFRHFARESYSDRIQTYDKEENWLGLRCLVTLK
ncbi:MAG: hypothetical protein ACTHMM_13265 [Agriterribacter sp.]